MILQGMFLVWEKSAKSTGPSPAAALLGCGYCILHILLGATFYLLLKKHNFDMKHAWFSKMFTKYIICHIISVILMLCKNMKITKLHGFLLRK
jgi:hypothetical protein